MLKSIENILDTVVKICALLALTAMLLVIFIDIVLRELFSSPLTWYLEVSQFCLIATTYFGAALALRNKQHISINMFIAMLDLKKQRLFSICTQLFTLPFIGLLAYSSIEILKKTKGVTPNLQLPMWIYYSPIFIGSVFLFAYAILSLYKEIKEI